MNNSLKIVFDELRSGLLTHTGVDAMPEPSGGVSAGQINRCMKVLHAGKEYFVKLNSAARLPMFEAEMAGLNELAATGTLRVPAPVFCTVAGNSSLLVMENLKLRASGDAANLGEGLAALHHTTASRFGWNIDNTIGLTPQINTAASDWIRFWARHRLGYQLDLAAANGYRGAFQDSGRRLLEEMHALFAVYQPQPSLLHGDLWAGNFAYLSSGLAVIYDPAVYYGDRETDLAMTELFGGFSREFYAAYESAYPLNTGYPVRKRLYNLYHVLNHLNLFGSGYLAQAESLIAGLLAELY